MRSRLNEVRIVVGGETCSLEEMWAHYNERKASMVTCVQYSMVIPRDAIQEVFDYDNGVDDFVQGVARSDHWINFFIDHIVVDEQVPRWVLLSARATSDSEDTTIFGEATRFDQ